jgi:hypothetical protein
MSLRTGDLIDSSRRCACTATPPLHMSRTSPSAVSAFSSGQSPSSRSTVTSAFMWRQQTGAEVSERDWCDGGEAGRECEWRRQRWPPFGAPKARAPRFCAARNITRPFLSSARLELEAAVDQEAGARRAQCRQWDQVCYAELGSLRRPDIRQNACDEQGVFVGERRESACRRGVLASCRRRAAGHPPAHAPARDFLGTWFTTVSLQSTSGSSSRDGAWRYSDRCSGATSPPGQANSFLQRQHQRAEDRGGAIRGNQHRDFGAEHHCINGGQQRPARTSHPARRR